MKQVKLTFYFDGILRMSYPTSGFLNHNLIPIDIDVHLLSYFLLLWIFFHPLQVQLQPPPIIRLIIQFQVTSGSENRR